MPDDRSQEDVSAKLAILAQVVYAALAAQFPVCLFSDEFHFFPQFRANRGSGAQWDDFSDGAVQTLLSNISQWRHRLDNLRHPQLCAAAAIDIDLLSRVLITLEEQLRFVRPQKTQPTFYLTILSIGLAESQEAPGEAFGRRINGMPEFLAAATANLTKVSVLYRDLAVEMIPKLGNWMGRLPMTNDLRRMASGALNRFHEFLTRIEPRSDFRLDGDLYARVADFHIGCHMEIDEITWQLESEIEAAARDLSDAAAAISPGYPWQTVFDGLPLPLRMENNDVAARYREWIDILRRHCLENSFVGHDVIAGCDVEIKTIPEHLTPIRANAAYTMPPGHPPRGGIFYITPQDRRAVPRDMKLLAAHETFPGHHLLDTIRWRLKGLLRRCLEFPLFYEGWASFSEEILFDTALFSGPVDQLMMAKRRFWRAQRGRVELGIHTGQYRLAEAAEILADFGLVTYGQALAMVKRYALKPGYQLSYAIGRRKFHQLYTTYIQRGRTPGQFVSRVLSQGQVGFEHLAQHLTCEK